MGATEYPGQAEYPEQAEHPEQAERAEQPPAAATYSVPWRRLPADVAPALRAVLGQMAREVSAQVVTSVPAFAAIGGSANSSGAKFSRNLDTAVRAGLERFVDPVATDQEALTPVVRELFTGLGAGEARDGRGPEILL